MKKIVVIGLVALALIAGFVLIQNVGAHGPMAGGGGYYPYGGQYTGPGYGIGPGMMGGGMMGPGMMGPGMMGPGYGGYCWGNNPGTSERTKTLTEKETEAILKNYIGLNPNLKVGEIKDKGPYFEGEILTKENSLVSKFSIDKNTGWVRPLY